MLFHTLHFAFFFLVVFPAFLLAPQRARWSILLCASLVFFGALGVPALVFALAAVTLASYGAGLCMGGVRARRPIWLWSGIAFNVLVLAAFRYPPVASLGLTGTNGLMPTVGVSYFTFQGISYLVDIYIGAQEPERHLGYFALYMAFFPKVLQGPIERAGELLPQLKCRFYFDSEAWRAGALLFAWGLFKKTVVADRAGPLVDAVYGHVTSYQGIPLAVATYRTPCSSIAIFLATPTWREASPGFSGSVSHRTSTTLTPRDPLRNSGVAGTFRFRAGFSTTSSSRCNSHFATWERQVQRSR